MLCFANWDINIICWNIDGWTPLDSRVCEGFYDNYTVRAASRPRNICSIGLFLNYLKRDRPFAVVYQQYYSLLSRFCSEPPPPTIPPFSIKPWIKKPVPFIHFPVPWFTMSVLLSYIFLILFSLTPSLILTYLGLSRTRRIKSEKIIKLEIEFYFL